MLCYLFTLAVISLVAYCKAITNYSAQCMKKKNTIRIFVFDSHNTGRYHWRGGSIIEAMNEARRYSHARIERGDGQCMDFWEYKNGEMIAWNAPML